MTSVRALESQAKDPSNNKMKAKFDILVVALIIAAVGTYVFKHQHNNSTVSGAATSSSSTLTNTAKTTNYCSDNSLGQKIIVSISKRHMWACQSSKTIYDNPVVTGMQMYAADLTPTGTYTITDKLTNQDLTGTDNTGSWNDQVSYWLPFLQNQNGVYGFHDATWRANSDFGNISPGSKNASHGCVEMPLNAAKWLYGWAQVGTTVVIEN